MHDLVALGKVLSVEDVIDLVTRADVNDDCTPAFAHLRAVSFVVMIFDLGLLECLVGQYLASSSQAKPRLSSPDNGNEIYALSHASHAMPCRVSTNS